MVWDVDSAKGLTKPTWLAPNRASLRCGALIATHTTTLELYALCIILVHCIVDRIDMVRIHAVGFGASADDPRVLAGISSTQ